MTQVAGDPDLKETGPKTKLQRLQDETSGKDSATAIEWVTQTFRDAIRSGEEVPKIYFVEITSTKKTRLATLTTMANGWVMIVSQSVEEVALEHIDIILSEELTDKEKIRAIIEKEKADDADTQRYTQAWGYFDNDPLLLETRKIR